MSELRSISPAARPLFVLAMLLIPLAALTGCAVPHNLSSAPPSGVPTPSTTESVGSPDENALVVRDASTQVQLESITIDMNTSDGPAPAADFEGDALYVFVRPAGWNLSAAQYAGPAVYACESWQTEPQLDDLGGGWWRVRPGGPAGSYALHLTAGSGPGLPMGGTVGSSEAVVGWETTVSGPEAAELGDATIAGEDGQTLMVSLRGLPQGWKTASTDVVVTGSSGVPLTTTIPHDRPDCVGRDEVWFDQELTAAQLSALGDGPFTYDVVVTVDETAYRATGQDTADESAALTFTH